MSSQIKETKSKSIYYFAWFAISLFFCYQYILRVSPGIMIVELRQVFKLSAEEFSSLGAICLYAYALLQIPFGFIIDRVGVRLVISTSVLICVMGTLIFAYATDLWMLQMGRFWIGVGSAPAFICALKLVSDFLPEKDRGFLMGATLAIGTLGALVTGNFLVTLLDTTGWKNSLLLCAGLGIVMFIIVMIFVPAPQSGQKTQTTDLHSGTFWTGLKEILKRKEIIIYAIIAISVYTPLCVLADLWGTAFLMEKFSLGRGEAANITLYMYGGLTIGSLTIPWLSLKTGYIKRCIQLCALGLIGALFLLLTIDDLSPLQLIILMTLIGAFCGAEMICFGGAAHYAPQQKMGLTLGVVNTLNMLGGALIQHAIGWYLDFQWQGGYDADGARSYGPDELTHGFSILLIIMIFCCALTLLLPKDKSLTAAPAPVS